MKLLLITSLGVFLGIALWDGVKFLVWRYLNKKESAENAKALEAIKENFIKIAKLTIKEGNQPAEDLN